MITSASGRRWFFILLVLALGGTFLCTVRLGAASITWQDLFFALTGRSEDLSRVERTVIFDIRLVRALAALVIGAVLAVCGAAMQGLFRNPLADPGLVGVTSGASVGGVLYMKLGATALAGVSAVFGSLMLPVCAFASGLLMTVVMHRCSQVGGRTVVSLMLLAGVAINALGGALIGLVLFFADDDQLRQFTFWTLGNVGHASWMKLAVAAPFLLVALVLSLRYARPLNALLLGEAEAGHLGVDLQRVKNTLIFATAAGVGAAVSVAGGIGFVGLIVPHLMRLVIGPDHRWLLPASALGGAILLAWADIFARTVAAPAELPIGVITAVVGAPVFFALLQSQRKTHFA
ncbi:FecCD family ABC transporter permease [Rariglobus hedericola]|uniref:Iron ABC transporter permease n=1 Tax=Rariglobus hedericola TaxID=2597822 RepID=A0A556QME1_9BACT|nr:iron ABC transporter permease [Rariglobus hedericola]TSJ77797.1 iron ABC transporter permease [Rariglobus hedericola]